MFIIKIIFNSRHKGMPVLPSLWPQKSEHTDNHNNTDNFNVKVEIKEYKAKK
jgi:hypothetical protein